MSELTDRGILIFVDAQIASIGLEHVLRWWYVLRAGSVISDC